MYLGCQWYAELRPLRSGKHSHTLRSHKSSGLYFDNSELVQSCVDSWVARVEHQCLEHRKYLLNMGESSNSMKTSCLYLCLVFLSILILITSFTIQWIMNSVQFGLVSRTQHSRHFVADMEKVAGTAGTF
jgi:hypothetical protein